jgi:hypothetical protein
VAILVARASSCVCVMGERRRGFTGVECDASGEPTANAVAPSCGSFVVDVVVAVVDMFVVSSPWTKLSVSTAAVVVLVVVVSGIGIVLGTFFFRFFLLCLLPVVDLAHS